jgi:hypothetical protein
VKHHTSQSQLDLMILKAPKQEMKTWGFSNGKLRGKKAVISSRT